MYRKTMREALEEARSYRDPVNEDKGFSSQQIKMAYGVLNDPRYKQGNYSGAFKAIEKIAKGLASHPDVANALKRANEELDNDDKETIKPIIKQLQKSVKAHDKQAKQLQKDIQDEVELDENFTKADFAKLEADNEHTEAAEKLINMFGTKEEKFAMAAIKARHNMTGYIKGPDYNKRQMMVNKYYSRLK